MRMWRGWAEAAGISSGTRLSDVFGRTLNAEGISDRVAWSVEKKSEVRSAGQVRLLR